MIGAAPPTRRHDTTENGKTVTRHIYTVREYDEVVTLPIDLVKPTVLAATERALALKIFDAVGVVRQRKQDPIIIGEIWQHPKTGWADPPKLSFFVAWWLDLKTL